MPTILNSRIFEEISQTLDFVNGYDPQYQYSDELALFQDPTTGQGRVTSLSSTQIQLTFDANPAISPFIVTLRGTGIGPVASLEALTAAIEDGTASGSFNNLSLAQGSVVLVDVSLTASGFVITSGPLRLAVETDFPVTFDDVFALTNAMAAVDNTGSYTALIAELEAYAFTGFTMTDIPSGTTLIDVDLSATSATIRLADLVYDVSVALPASLGDLVDMVVTTQATYPLATVSDILEANTDVTRVQIRHTDGSILATLTPDTATSPDVVTIDGVNVPSNFFYYFELILEYGQAEWVGDTTGSDNLIAGAGAEVIWVGNGNDTVSAGDGNDWIGASAGNNLIFAGLGDDVVFSGPGSETVYGGVGADSFIQEDSSRDQVWLGDGNDKAFVESGGSTVGGGTGNDEITIYGTGTVGNVAWGGVGNDMILAIGGNDTIGLGTGNDTVFAGAGDDFIWGGLGDDYIAGEAGNEEIWAGPGADTVFGGLGNDTIVSRPGDDILFGGDGADQFVFYRNYNSDVIADFDASEGDTLGLAHWMWSGTKTEAQLVADYAFLNTDGDIVFSFGTANTTFVMNDYGNIATIADHIVII